MVKCGVYLIRNLKNSKGYVGGTTDINRRWTIHKCNLNSNKHGNSHLQSDWNLYGKQCFEFQIIELCESDVLILKEQKWIDFYNSVNSALCYNVCLVVGSGKGIRHTDTSRKKISMANKGRIRSLEARLRYSVAKSGKRHPLWKKHHSKETRLKMSHAHSGKKFSEEHKRKISEANKGKRHRSKGRICTEETRKKISKANKGQIPWNKKA